MSDERYFDVFRHRQRFRPILLRRQPCDWDTAVEDYRRYVADGATMSMFEVTRDGGKIREIPAEEITTSPEGAGA